MTKDRELLHIMRIDGIESCTLNSGLQAMTEKARKDLMNECGKVDFYERVACLYLLSCSQDGKIAPEELDNVKSSISYIFSRAGVVVDVEDVIKKSLELMRIADAYLLDGTVSVFRKYLSKETLKGIINDCYYMCDADGVADEEGTFILDLYKRFLG